MAITPATLRRVRLDIRVPTGKPCGASFIPKDRQCRKGSGGFPPAGAALTPGTLAKAPRRGTGEWQRKAAIAAGVTATGLALGLPAAAFIGSGTAPGRRASKAIETFSRETGRGLMTWGSGPLAPIGVPLGAGFIAGAEGMRVGRMGRRIIESWRAAPGFARGAAGLADRKSRSAAARESYLAKLQSTWLSGQKPITPTEARRRAAEVQRTQQQINRLQRQAATRARAARRSARIARTGAPFRNSPTFSEAWLRTRLQSDLITRTPAALSAGWLRSLQSTNRGPNARRPRFYGARKDADGQPQGKPCGQSHIAKSKKCHLGEGPDNPPAGPVLTPAKVLGTAAIAGGVAAAVYAWSKQDSNDLRAALQGRPIFGSKEAKPNLVERLLAERRAKRCGRRGDALPLSATNECAVSTFAEIYLSKDGKSVFKVQKEPDLKAARHEFEIQSAAYALGVPTARPLAIHPRTGVIRMEHLKGRTGEEIFGERFDASRYPEYGLQLSAVMRKLHRAGISHGDVHIGNWMETRKGLHLIDWGMGSRKKEDLIYELEDSQLGLGLGLGMGEKGMIRRHPALDDYEALLKKTLIELDFLKPGTAAWRKAIDSHYDSLEVMLRKAKASPGA